MNWQRERKENLNWLKYFGWREVMPRALYPAGYARKKYGGAIKIVDTRRSLAPAYKFKNVGF